MGDQVWLALGIFALMGGVLWLVFKVETDGRPPVVEPVKPDEQQNPPISTEATARRAGAWSAWGWSLAIFGSIGAAVSLTMKTTVEHFTPSTILGPGGSSEVVNLDLMFHKGVAIAASLSAIGIGVFCIAVGAIINAIYSRG